LLLVLSGAAHGPTRLLFAVQLLLQIGAVFAACALLRGMGATQGLTLLVGALGLLPPFVQPAAYVLTENLAQFCVVLGLFGLVRFLDAGHRGWLLASSAAFGYAALTRPTFQLLTLGLCVLLGVLAAKNCSRTFPLRDAFLLVVGTVALVGAWAAYSQIRFGTPGTTSTLGSNLANRGPDLYEGIPDPTTRRLFVNARNQAYVAGEAVAWAHFSTEPALKKELGLQSDHDMERWVRSQMLQAIAHHPVQYGQIVAGSLARFWFPVSGSLRLLRERPLQLAWYGVHLVVVALLALELFAFGAWIATVLAGLRTDEQTRRAWVLWTLCAAVVVYNALISCALETGETRYRTSTEILLPLAAAAGIVASRGLFRTLVAIRTKISRGAPGS
jgi:hypothetical protein